MANSQTSSARNRDVLYSIRELYDKLEEFQAELVAAKLRANTVDTYVGRSTIFVDWLAGKYHPRGPIA